MCSICFTLILIKYNWWYSIFVVRRPVVSNASTSTRFTRFYYVNMIKNIVTARVRISRWVYYRTNWGEYSVSGKMIIKGNSLPATPTSSEENSLRPNPTLVQEKSVSKVITLNVQSLKKAAQDRAHFEAQSDHNTKLRYFRRERWNMVVVSSIGFPTILITRNRPGDIGNKLDC